MSDENTESNGSKPTKEVQQAEPAKKEEGAPQQEEDTPPGESSSMDAQTDKIKGAGMDEEGGTTDDTNEEALPEPVEKTPAEMLENPNDVLDGKVGDVPPANGDGTIPQKDVTPSSKTKDGLPLDGKNPEELESVKNHNADGDEAIKKDDPK